MPQGIAVEITSEAARAAGSKNAMVCRSGCDACCIVPSIVQPFYGMPEGKKAGLKCVHLKSNKRCALFDDPRRPLVCAAFLAEPAVCGETPEQALQTLSWLERVSDPSGDAAVGVTQ